MEKTKSKKKTPFSFVLDELDSRSPVLKPMFGAHIVYIGEKMMLFLRDMEKEPEHNGIWVATTPEAFRSLAAEFSSTRTYKMDEIGKSPWILLPASVADFEEQAFKVCELILKGDPRIGRAPKAKKARPPAKRKNVKNKNESS